jgi:hypothetical protein
MALEPVAHSRPYSASEFRILYKIPIEIAMLEIINFIILYSGASLAFMQPPQEICNFLVDRIQRKHQGAGRE